MPGGRCPENGNERTCVRLNCLQRVHCHDERSVRRRSGVDVRSCRRRSGLHRVPCAGIERLRSLLPSPRLVVVETYTSWRSHRTIRLGASLAYYGLFAIVPLLAISFAVAGLVISEADAWLIASAARSCW